MLLRSTCCVGMLFYSLLGLIWAFGSSIERGSIMVLLVTAMLFTIAVPRLTAIWPLTIIGVTMRRLLFLRRVNRRMSLLTM